jgi:hypothetical protein
VKNSVRLIKLDYLSCFRFLNQIMILVTFGNLTYYANTSTLKNKKNSTIGSTNYETVVDLTICKCTVGKHFNFIFTNCFLKTLLARKVLYFSGIFYYKFFI